MTKPSFQQLVDELLTAFGTPATLVDTDNHLLAFSAQPQQRSDIVRRNSLLGRTVDAEVESYIGKHIRGASTFARVPASQKLGLSRRAVYSIYHGGTVQGYLYLIDSEDQLTETSLFPFEPLLRQVGQEIELERFAVGRSYRVVSGLVSDDADQRSAAAEILLDAMEPAPSAFRIGAIASDTDSVAAGIANFVWKRVFEGYPAWGIVDNMHVVVIGSGAAIAPRSGTDEMEDSARRKQITPALERWPRQLATPLVGLGGWVKTADECQKSYHQALRALRFARAGLQDSRTADWETLGAWRPLLLLSRHDAVASLDARIADLIGGEDPQLLLMLQRYLERVEDVAAISASFHVHRTTFYSRVNRVQKKYDLDWEDAEDRLLTIIGIRIGLLYALHR